MPVLLKDRARKRNSSGDPEEFRATLVEHLEELRDRIIRSLSLLVVGWIVGWFLQPWVYAQLEGVTAKAIRASLPPGVTMQYVLTSVQDAFMLKMKLAFMIGIFLAAPFLVLQLWGFVAPGLKPSERKPLQTAAPFSVLLFAIGAGFCWLIVPAAVGFFGQFFADFQGTSLFQEPGKMIGFVLKMMLAFGISFQLPLIVFILGKMGVLTPESMIGYWRQAAVIIFFASALLTPGADPISMMMMAVPLCILFMISVFAVKLTNRKPQLVSELDDLD